VITIKKHLMLSLLLIGSVANIRADQVNAQSREVGNQEVEKSSYGKYLAATTIVEKSSYGSKYIAGAAVVGCTILGVVAGGYLGKKGSAAAIGGWWGFLVSASAVLAWQ
jgi:hypothetical protein